MKLNPAKLEKTQEIAARLSNNSSTLKVEKPKLLGILALHPELEKASGLLRDDGHFTQAVFEGCKALSEYVRQKTGLTKDNTPLMQEAFSSNNPHLPLNTGTTQAEKDEQLGFMNIAQGVMQGIRNPRAHGTNVDTPERATAYLNLISLLFEIVDEAVKRKSSP